MGEVVSLFDSVIKQHTCLDCKSVFDVEFYDNMPEDIRCPSCNSSIITPYRLASIRANLGPVTVCDCGGNLFYAFEDGIVQCAHCANVYDTTEEPEDED